MVTENEQYEVALRRHLELEEKAKAVAAELKDIPSFQQAVQFAQGVKDFRKQWEGMIAPAKEAAFEAHRAICEMEDKVAEPLERAEKEILKPAIARFELEEEARRKAQEERLKTETGHNIEVPNETRMKGVSYKTSYFAEVTDVRLLLKAVLDGSVPLEAVSPNLKAINQAARSFKETLNWPGIMVKSERVVVLA